MKTIALIFFLLFSALSGFSATVFVPDDYPTIQEAIDDLRVVNGDRVIVRSGNYQENIDFKGKAILVRSEFGPELTIIDGSRFGSVVKFDCCEGPGSVLQGFTLTNGLYGYGGGIYCGPGTSPYITGNVICYNGANFNGGGVCCQGASPVIYQNTIMANFSVRGGGAAFLDGSAASVTQNYFYENEVTWSGAALQAFGSSPQIRNNVFERNSSGVYAGGMIGSEGAAVLLSGNLFTKNEAGVYGGGMVCGEDSTFEILDNTFVDNHAGVHGGGILCRRFTSILMENTIIAGNLADKNGGGIYFTLDKPGPTEIRNCTIYGNTAADTGGGIYGDSSTSQIITNSVIWGNTAVTGFQVYGKDGCTQTLVHCDVEGGAAGAGIVDEPPGFIDVMANDFHLAWDSPLINRGTSDGIPETDIDGDPRMFMGAVDLGADEFTGVHSLGSDAFEVSASTGSAVNFFLDARPDQGGRTYLVLGTLSGVMPGTPLPGGLAVLPINWDAFTDMIVFRVNSPKFSDFYGVLDASGHGTAQLNTPHVSPLQVGKTMHYAYYLDGVPWDFASNPVPVTFMP